jgi:hypothetical protein
MVVGYIAKVQDLCPNLSCIIRIAHVNRSRHLNYSCSPFIPRILYETVSSFETVVHTLLKQLDLPDVVFTER